MPLNDKDLLGSRQDFGRADGEEVGCRQGGRHLINQRLSDPDPSL